MYFEVIPIPPFDKQLKKLSKKYPSLKNDYDNLIKSLEKDPKQGKLLGNDCYKIRLAIKSKGKGKSSGARVITHLRENSVYLLSIYDKSEKENITDAELRELLMYIE